MGLGKTIQLITTMLGNKKQKTLVIVPKSIIKQWATEIKRFAPAIAVYVFDGPKRALSAATESWTLDPETPSVVIASYNVLSRKNQVPGTKTAIHHVEWDRIIIDEAHEIRNKHSKVFKNVCLLTTDIKWIVTGTPVFNSNRDFLSLCDFLGIDRRLKPRDIHDNYILRRTKADLADDNERLRLPPCDFENVELDMLDEEKSLYEFVYRETCETMQESEYKENAMGSKNMEIIEFLLRLRQCMICPQVYLDGVAKKSGVDPERWTGRSNKMETLFRLIDEHPREKSLIFCQYHAEMNYIQSKLTPEEVHDYDSDDSLMGCGLDADPAAAERNRIRATRRGVFRIDGSVSKEDRDRQVEDFKASPPGSIFIIQIRTGGVGLNLQEATRVYITAPSWNPAIELQAVGRSHRMGQTQHVRVKKLVYKGCARFVSVEEEIMALQGHKSILCAEVLNDPRLKDQIPIGGRRTSKIDLMKKILGA